MFIAHLPAGYLATKVLIRRDPNNRSLMATGLIASILPDIDLLWFYLVDNRQTVHHSYIFHWPLFWVFLAAALWLFAFLLNRRYAGAFILLALFNILLHMALDSIVGGIGWFRPFSDTELNLVEVPARYGWWVWSFVLHWTFLFEVLIVTLAAATLWRSSRKPGGG